MLQLLTSKTQTQNLLTEKRKNPKNIYEDQQLRQHNEITQT